MRQSKAEIYFHLVWATKGREPWLTPEVERAVYRCIEAEARGMGCVVLGIGGMPDHVHLCVRAPARLSPSEIAKRVKGVSSHFAHDHLPGREGFAWQEGYGVFSLSRTHVEKVIAYIACQKQHHANADIWAEWEETDEEYHAPTHPASGQLPRLQDGRPKAP